MYSAVRDAAIVVGKGMKNILAKKNKRNQIIGFSTNLSCPLQSSNGNGLGKTILKELKEVGNSDSTNEVLLDLTPLSLPVHSLYSLYFLGRFSVISNPSFSSPP